MGSGQSSFAKALQLRLQRATDTGDRREATQQSRTENAGRRAAEGASTSAKPKTGATNAEHTRPATSKDAKATKNETQAQTTDGPSDEVNGLAMEVETADAAPKGEDDANLPSNAPNDSDLADDESQTVGFLLSDAHTTTQVDANAGVSGRRPSEGALTEGQASMTNLVKGAKVSPDAPFDQATNGSPATNATVSSSADALAPIKLENAGVSFEKSVKAGLGETFAKVAGIGFESSPALAQTPEPEGHTAATGVHQALQTSLPGGGRVAVAIDVRFGSENWSAQVAERSAHLAFQNIQSAQLQLDPPELGPLSVKIHMHQDQAVVQFVTSNAQVKEALDGAMNRLRELLQEQGIDLLEADVRDESQSQERERHAAAERNRDFGESALGDAETPKTVIEVSSGIDYFV